MTSISVTEAANETTFNRSYIKAEIAAGRLPATKVGHYWTIDRADFDAWLSNPRRGSRAKQVEDAMAAADALTDCGRNGPTG